MAFESILYQIGGEKYKLGIILQKIYKIPYFAGLPD
jgi:hypothetical protein